MRDWHLVQQALLVAQSALLQRHNNKKKKCTVAIRQQNQHQAHKPNARATPHSFAQNSHTYFSPNLQCVTVNSRCKTVHVVGVVFLFVFFSK